VFCLSAPSGARLLLFVVCLVPRVLAFPDRSNAAKEANRTASAAVNNLAEKTSFSSTGTEEAFYEGYLGHTNGGSSRYLVFDYVAQGGTQLGTQQRAGPQQHRKGFGSRSAFGLEEPLVLNPLDPFPLGRIALTASI